MKHFGKFFTLSHLNFLKKTHPTQCDLSQKWVIFYLWISARKSGKMKEPLWQGSTSSAISYMVIMTKSFITVMVTVLWLI